MRDRRKSLCVPSNLIWVLGDFDKIFRIDDFVLVLKVFFDFLFFSSAIQGQDQNSSYQDQKDTPIAGLRMFVAFFVFAKAPCK